MSKAVIYIDTEDDITSIIDRLKASKSDIVALVPPKRIGVLQSIVNLKLLKRAAVSEKKRVVLITNDQSLMSLAGGLSIPTAKNLQSRPEVAAISAVEVDGNDVINGDELPIGDMNDALSDKKMPVNSLESADPPTETPAVNKAVPLKKGGKSSLKVPDFMKFRKRLFIIGGLVILLGIFLWWALIIAPSASIAIKARTEIANIDRSLSLDPGALQTDEENNALKPVIQQIKKNETVEFTATGKKDVGEKATGTAVITNCASRDAATIPAGTALSANGLNFLTAAAVEVPGGSSSSAFGGCDRPGSASVRINAQNVGEEYNLPGNTMFAVAGASNAVKGRTENGTSGGSKRQVNVISDGDVAAAKQKIADQDDNAAKEELAEKFATGNFLVEESFKTEVGEPSVSPEVGAEAAKATLTVETTYSMLAVNNDDLDAILNNAIRDEIGEDEDRKSIYENGRQEIEVSEYQALDGGRATMRIKTTGYIGAKVDEKQLKEDIVGKRYGEIEALVKSVPNVESVEINFSPFWVTSAPSSEKIELTFEIIKNEQN